MIHRDRIDDRCGEVLEEQSSPAVKHVISALDLLSTLPAAPHARQLDPAMTRLLTRQTAVRPPRRPAPTRRRHAQAWTLLCVASLVASLAAALLVALGGLAGYPRLKSPTPVSARGVLFRAVAALRQTMPDTVIHDRGTLFFPHTGAASIAGSAIIETPVTATVDQWTQLDAAGGIGRRVTTYTGHGGALLARVLLASSVARVLGVQHTDGPAIYTVETFVRPYGARALTLTVAGRTIRAVYFEPKEGLPAGYTTDHSLLYTSGVPRGKVVSVSIISMGLGKGVFLSALRTLVDGHTHPRVAARLQRELDASTVSVGSTTR